MFKEVLSCHNIYINLQDLLLKSYMPVRQQNACHALCNIVTFRS